MEDDHHAIVLGEGYRHTERKVSAGQRVEEKRENTDKVCEH